MEEKIQYVFVYKKEVIDLTISIPILSFKHPDLFLLRPQGMER